MALIIEEDASERLLITVDPEAVRYAIISPS